MPQPPNLNPSTGAAGNTGVVGSPPSHPRPVNPQAPGAAGKPWNETPQGVHMAGGYDAFRSCFQTQLPSLREQIALLAKRPIGG